MGDPMLFKNRSIRGAAVVSLFSIFTTSNAQAYPVLDAVQGLPFPELVTVYPDDANHNLYYFVPTTVALVKNEETGKPHLGVQYWGLTGLDPAGVGAALTFSVKPGYDKKAVDEVAKGLKKINPDATFAFPALVDSSMDLIINGAFVPKSQDTTKPTIKGGTVDSTQAFTIGLTNIGARAFAQGVSAESDLVAARYTYKFTGVAKRLRAEVIVHHKKVYDHFKVRATSTSWWGMKRMSWAADWQKLTQDGSIVLKITEGGEVDNDPNAYMMEVFKAIVNAKVGETGMFAPKLEPKGTDVQNGGSNFGWGFSGGAAWEHLEERVNFTFSINTQKLEDREFSAALSFSAVCAKYPDSFVDLTTIGKKCIDKTAFADVQKAEQQCLADKLKFYNDLLQQKLITQQQYDEKAGKLLNEPCYSNFAVAQADLKSGLKPKLTAKDLSNRNKCAVARLEALNEDYEKGKIPASEWSFIQARALDVPCVNNNDTGDVLMRGIGDSLQQMRQSSFDVLPEK